MRNTTRIESTFEPGTDRGHIGSWLVPWDVDLDEGDNPIQIMTELDPGCLFEVFKTATGVVVEVYAA